MFEKRRPGAVLFDRDGTLIRDVPYNGDPDLVEPMPGAIEALHRLRHADVPVAVVTNQSGVAKGLLTPDEMDQVNAKVEELLGPFDAWAICVHDDADGCTCRKPAPGLVIRAAAVLDVSPRDCVVVGDIGRDMEAARAAGARGILVPTQETLREEITQAAEVADDLIDVVDRVLSDAESPVPAAAAPWARAMGWSRW
ncbi:D-glycero-D-manno-heptose 1,7-bisphosphate phosphatase; Histidinol-phosphatase [[Actinomadura] parvosata subsp. kistnae]|uniref:D-glycero-alpha-D-manno-heptose-1,7-bisphosphate 7-phosphatase n=1 Tax=Nonomuraea TaxID=83681 RepID=UPI000D297C3C|nr:HAD-IIIA family hydrolase [Nonomuraea sp. ATCC 55076]SPL87474.1 D-glycero-D-manno-heptose 1,7-bisphosphate phosphatase; Histidinol-phosphatase [Actinomadura parvosata subsp. kistnae]